MVMTLVACSANIPRKSISRTLDDFQGVGSTKTNTAEDFANGMKTVCEELNIPLAKLCPQKEKAFVLETEGVVLGTRFNSESMLWSWAPEKVDKVIRRCHEACSRSHLSLQQTQELMGTVNDLAQMNRFLRFFKSSGNALLSRFKNNENILLLTPEETKEDWRVIGRAAESATGGLPIASRKNFPPMSALIFYTDAAGAKYCKAGNEFRMMEERERGVSCIGGEIPDTIWIWSKLNWTKSFLELHDKKGVEYGRKSTTLESFGLLLPFVAFPELVAGRHLIFYVDNKAVHYGWEHGYVKNDGTATELLKAVHILSSYLGCHVHVYHILRVSNKMADLADQTSRKSLPQDKQLREILENTEIRNVNSEILKIWDENDEIPKYEKLLSMMKKLLT